MGAYTNLKTVMSAKNVTVDSLASLLGVHRNTVGNKLEGDSEFSYSQAEKIQMTCFPEYTARFLFHRDAT